MSQRSVYSSFCCLCGREGHLSKDCKWGRQ